ncbi:MAG: flagellar biosynthesis anti-sigma factor FlgM [Methylophaga sp.]|nr:MAG: flagellar biosynthesis anti-sigma factor FlgM [Methylophaga sp.]
MSEINNIKTTAQSGLNASKIGEKGSQGGDKSQSVQAVTTRTDTVSLTNEATQLQSIQKTLEDTPIVNSERVEALRAAIAEGSYTVDAVELAQNIIDFETELL